MTIDKRTESVQSEERMGKDVPLVFALTPIVILVGLLALNVALFGDSATLGANQIALMVAAAVTVGFGCRLGTSASVCIDAMTTSIASSLKAILILLVVGGLIGTWMISGVVPSMVYYGLQILNPSAFLVLAVLISSIVSVATGSSWTTSGTVGVALLGIGTSMGIDPAMVAGAVISGAYFGDKISPLSDTTNLAPAMAGTDLYTHIRYMLWTTIPSYTLTLIGFAALSYYYPPKVSELSGVALSNIITSEFHVSMWLMLVPAAVIVMVAKRIDPVVALFFAMLLGAVFAVIFQPSVINRLAWGGGENGTKIVSNANWQLLLAEEKDRLAASGMTAKSDSETDEKSIEPLIKGNYASRSYIAAVKAMALDCNVETGVDEGDKLLKGKGMSGMLGTVWLIVCAMCFGGAMEATGFLERITRPLVEIARSTGSLIATTASSCLLVNLTASDQYLAIVVPGRMFRKTFEERGLAPQNLSRTLEDSGTVTSVLVPWNTCGAYQAGVLDITTFAYAPFAIFCWISPLMTVLIAILGIGIAKIGSPGRRDD